MVKKAPTVDANADFVTGAIVRIKLTNFMIFSTLEMHPGARMNVILGPNGSGKSSIFCGICLGLGGRPSNVGRATALSDYIKHGCEKASIEIELFNAIKGNFVVKRVINQNNQSQWSINTKNSTQKEVDQLTSRLNIQMKNLCQFLPQDKVVEFVRMSKEELLENTQKAANVDDLWENHCRLKNWNTKSKDLETNYALIVEDFDKESQRLSYLQEQVDLYNERNGFVEKIATYRKKKAWLVYENEFEKYRTLSKELKAKEKEQAQFNASLNLLRKSLDDCKTETQQLDSKIKRMSSVSQEQKNKVDSKLLEVERLKDVVSEVKETFNSKEVQENQRVEKLQLLESQLKKLQDDYSDIESNAAEIDREFKAVSQELADCLTEGNKINAIKESLIRQRKELERELSEVKNELRQNNDVHRAKMQVLSQKDRDAHTLAKWLQSNREKFQGKVYGPIMLELNVHDSKNAKYVERSIAFVDLIAFVCENDHDIEVLINAAKNELRLKVDAVMAPSTPSSQFQPFLTIEDIKEYGFQSYLREMVDAPEPVMRYLCQQHHIHEIPVGNDLVRSRVDEVMNYTNIRRCYSTNHHYKISQSKYGNRNMGYHATVLKRANILTFNVNTAQIKVLENRSEVLTENIANISNELLEVQNQERCIHQKTDQLRSQKKELGVKINERKELSLKIAHKEDMIHRVVASKIDLEEEKQKRNRRLSQLIDQKMVFLGQHAKLCREMIPTIVDRAALTCDLRLLARKSRQLENEIREKSKEIEEMKNTVDITRSNLLRTKQIVESLLRDAKKLCNMTGNKIPREIEDLLAMVPNSADEIDQEIHQLEAKIECMRNVNAAVLADYEVSQEKMKGLEQQKAKFESEMQKFESDMSAVKNRWLPPLQSLMTNINKRFSYYFSSLGCSGEVGLCKGENENDFSKYGINIKVKFRDSDPLRELTQFYQSGGERSVATVLYLLSLQEFVKLPFCCVDEINQGMDSTNERRVFQLMTQILCSETRSQYFLVTPKLLPNMEFHENVQVNLVLSGEDVWKSKVINMKGAIEKRRALED